MSTLLARTGRHRQRYVDQFRLVAGCIPYKLDKNVEDQGCNGEDRVLILMISTPNRSDLVFPKGGWENDETVGEAACREAIEEAGVKGILGEVANPGMRQNESWFMFTTGKPIGSLGVPKQEQPE